MIGRAIEAPRLSKFELNSATLPEAVVPVGQHSTHSRQSTRHRKVNSPSEELGTTQLTTRQEQVPRALASTAIWPHFFPPLEPATG